MTKTRDDGMLDLPMPPGDKLGPGPVYQGVAKQIRRMLADDRLDRDVDAGAIAAARSAARSVDHAAGHNARGAVGAGMQQAALHAALLAWLDKLGGTMGEGDPFAQLLHEFNREGAPGGRAEAPHPEV